MADKKVKFGFGEKGKIESAKESGKIDSYDMVVATDTDELAYVTSAGETKFFKDRTDEPVTFNGVTIGNISNGDTVPAGITFTEFLKLVGQKAIPATYTQPSVTIVNNGGQAAGNVEAGTSITPKLRATFNKNDAGDLSTIKIKRGATELATGTTSPLDYTAESPIIVGDETIVITAEASYGEGAIKNNNLGQPSPDGHIVAGTKNSSAYNITGKRNLFYGTGVGTVPELTSDIVRSLIDKKLAPSNGYSFTINVAIGQQYILFAYPEVLRDVNQVKYEETNDATLAQNFTKTVIDVADARGGANGIMPYKVYSYGMAVPAAAPMTLTVTI